MIREFKDPQNYPRVISLLSILSLLFGVVTCLLGELFLPLSAAFLATLFLFENPKKRFLSYICPAVSIVLAVLLKGIAAIISIEYVLIAFVIAICYKKSFSKAETSIYITLIISAFIFISLYLGAAFVIKDFSLNAVTTHYVEAYADLKRDFVDLFSGFAVNGDDGTIEHAMSVEEAESYFDSITTSFIGLIAVISFLITGLTLKLYSHLILRFSKHGILKTFAHFLPSNFCAYLYIISTVLGWLASETSTFGIILININFILETVFLYMGLKYLVMISNVSQRKRLTYFLLALGILSFPSFVPSLISYLGVWVVIGTNLNNKASKV